MDNEAADAQLWKRWQDSYPADTLLTKDGAGAEYSSATRRILVVLKEPNASPGTDARDQLNKGVQHQVWYALARWCCGLLRGFPNYDIIAHDRALLSEALRSVAVINLKKVSGGATADGASIHRYAIRDRELLREQIRGLTPHLILACGTFEPMLWLLERDLPVDATGDLVDIATGAVLIRWRHPARSHGRQDYDNLRELTSGHLT